jgi:hypothetical protein
MVLCATIFLFLTTCSDSDPTSPTDPTGTEGLSFTIVSGDQQFWLAGYELPAPIVIMATDYKGKPVKDQLVNFRVTGGGGSVFAGSAVTDDDGIAQDYWALGTQPGPNSLEVRAVDPTTGEKHVYAQLHAEGLPGAEDLQVIQELLNHMWIRALTERVELSSSDVATALGTDFDQIVRNLEPAGVLSEVDEAITDIEGLLATPEPPNLVDYAFLAHVIRFCRNRFDAVMELIPTVSSTGG